MSETFGLDIFNGNHVQCLSEMSEIERKKNCANIQT